MNWEIYFVFVVLIGYVFLSYAIMNLKKQNDSILKILGELGAINSTMVDCIRHIHKYDTHHGDFDSVALQYILIGTRIELLYHRQQMIANEHFENIKDLDGTIREIEKLISTKIND